MTEVKVKPGPVPQHDFASIEIGTEVMLDPLKVSSFKSKVTKFNSGKDKADRQGYRYTQQPSGRKIIATRIR